MAGYNRENPGVLKVLINHKLCIIFDFIRTGIHTGSRDLDLDYE